MGEIVVIMIGDSDKRECKNVFFEEVMCWEEVFFFVKLVRDILLMKKVN